MDNNLSNIDTTNEGMNKKIDLELGLDYKVFMKQKPKYFHFFIGNLNIILLTLIVFIVILLEIIFRFINEEYGNRPTKLYAAIITPLLFFAVLIIGNFIVRLFIKKVCERIN